MITSFTQLEDKEQNPDDCSLRNRSSKNSQTKCNSDAIMMTSAKKRSDCGVTMTSSPESSSNYSRWMRRVAIAVLFLALFFSLPSPVDSQCSEDESEDSLVPFPPSIQPLDYLKLLEYNGPEFRLSCELLVCSISKPITYDWFFAKYANETGEALSRIGHEDKKSENYHFEGNDLIIHADYGDWDALIGYYWCTAQNEHGMASSTKCLVDKTKVKTRPEDLPPITIKSEESVHIAMEKPPLTPQDVPLGVFYTVASLDDKNTEILRPKVRLESKDGRFVIGDDFDLYILDAKTSDSCRVTQFFQEFGTMTNFAYRTAEINVDTNRFEGVQSGFFESYEDYLFVRNKKNSYITCIPKKPGKVKFQKDGKDLELSENSKESVYRTDYAIWFSNPTEENSGKYTCIREDDPTVKVTKTLRVIGAPLMKCDFYVFIIRTPGDQVKMSCTITSDFLKLNEPQIYLNDKPFDPASVPSVSFKRSTKKITNGYSVEIVSDKLTDKDNGVFRYVGSSAPMTKENIMKTMKYDPVKDANKVYFNDFRVLPFESREEVSVAVFVMPLKIKEHDSSERSDALVGESNFVVRSIIYGSPLPDVQWLVDGEEIKADNSLYSFRTRLTVVFDFLIKTVEKSVNITAFGTHTIEGELHHVSDHFRVQAHEPMEWQPGLPTSANTINGNDANVLCAATQKGGVLTGIVKITWLRAKDLSQIFSGSGGFQISDGEQEVDGATYSTSTLKFKPEDNSLHKFICVAKLIAGQKQHTLQTIQHNVSVEVGVGPDSPIDLAYDGTKKLFSWTAQRIANEYEMKDVVQSAEVFQETENEEPEWKELGASQMYLGRAGIHDIKASLSELTDYEMNELPTGAKFKFRVYTQNKFGKSGFSNVIETITPDAEPTLDLTGVAVKPAGDGSSKVVVSWDPYPRDKFGSFDKNGCCIHVEVEAVTRSGETKTLTLDCVDPEETEVETGWPDMAPYTKHKVKAWFSNDAGETDKAEVEGYNAEAKPSKPNLSEDQPEEQPREVSVEFDSMTDEDLNGKFKDYKLIVRDENGTVVGETTVTDQGKPGEKVKLTVDGLDPFSNYTAEVIVSNQEYSTSTGEIPTKTVATKPAPIDPDSIRVMVHPEGVVVFWEPTEPNGIFKDYLIKFQDFGGTEDTTVVPFFDATDLFFDEKGNPTANVKGYPFEIAAQNHMYTGDFTPANVDFTIVTSPPENPRPPAKWSCDLLNPARLGAEWTYKEFGNFATSHSIIYGMIEDALEDYNESCDPTALTDTQHCYPEVDQEPGKFRILLLARNKYGAAMSSPRICKATWASSGFLQPESEMQGFSTAGATLIMFLILLILLLIILALIAVYYTKNRSHNYRVRKTESRFKPKDIEFLPRKDETNQFKEYVPDETLLPFISPHKHTGPVDMETDSFDGPYGGDEDLDGYNEDGSFIGAYVEDSVYRSA